MYNYYIRYYLHTIKKRWFIVIGILLLAIFIVKGQVFSDIMYSNNTIDMGYFIFGIFQQPLLMLLVIPICFYIISSDLFIIDYRSDVAQLSVSRIKNKFNYIKCKLATLIIISNIITIIIIISILIVGIYCKIPLNQGYQYINFNTQYALSYFEAIGMQYVMLLLMMLGFGLIINNVALIFGTSYHSLIITVIMLAFSQYTFFANRMFIKLDYFSQIILSIHMPFCQRLLGNDMTDGLSNFTIYKSIYYYSLIIIFNILILIIINMRRSYAIGDKND